MDLLPFFMDSIESQDSEHLHTTFVEPKSEEQEKRIKWAASFQPNICLDSKGTRKLRLIDISVIKE